MRATYSVLTEQSLLSCVVSVKGIVMNISHDELIVKMGGRSVQYEPCMMSLAVIYYQDPQQHRDRDVSSYLYQIY